MSDIELAEQWLSETSRQIKALVDFMPKELGVTEIDISSGAIYIHGTDKNGNYVLSRLFHQGYDGIFFDKRFYPDREVEEDGATD